MLKLSEVLDGEQILSVPQFIGDKFLKDSALLDILF